MSGVLDDLEAVPPRKAQHPCHVARIASEMDGHYRFASRRDATLGLIEIDGERIGFYIDQNNFGAEIANYRSGGREGQCRHDHLVARTDSAGFGGEVQARGGRVHRVSLDAAAEKICEFSLEFSHLRP